MEKKHRASLNHAMLNSWRDCIPWWYHSNVVEIKMRPAQVYVSLCSTPRTKPLTRHYARTLVELDRARELASRAVTGSHECARARSDPNCKLIHYSSLIATCRRTFRIRPSNLQAYAKNGNEGSSREKGSMKKIAR